MLVMDLAMPVLDGMHATEIVREHMYRGATTPIVAVSSFVPTQAEEALLPPGRREAPESEAAAMFSETVSYRERGAEMGTVNSLPTSHLDETLFCERFSGL